MSCLKPSAQKHLDLEPLSAGKRCKITVQTSYAGRAHHRWFAALKLLGRVWMAGVFGHRSVPNDAERAESWCSLM